MFEPQGAFDGLLSAQGGEGAGVTAQALTGVGIASIVARRGATAQAAALMRELWGVETPPGPGRASSGEIALVGVSPGGWLCLNYANTAWADAAARALGDLAAVVDQSGGLGLLRLGGPDVGHLLAKGAFLDLHPSVFGPGAAAATNIAHVAVHLWRIDEEIFELAVPRSFSAAFADWLHAASAEYGLSISA